MHVCVYMYNHSLKSALISHSTEHISNVASIYILEMLKLIIIAICDYVFMYRYYISVLTCDYLHLVLNELVYRYMTFD